jgi:hypothetical protein
MRRMTQLLFLLCLLIAGPARADLEAPNAADAAAIRGVIEAQLKAVQADDGAQAFSYASPAIQSIFKDPDTFMSMVRSGYQSVYRPRQVEFRDLVPVQGRLTQRVLVVGPDGVPVVAQYVMERQPDGSWRIDGCTLERSAEQTT